ncbi:uncharacterized protein BDR25DRAFT_206563 [Lindgomyces ingoldianus]|uniref:Uncharacterized protein n=1 Tax=Lindgomyces ingoldianus TaxID=673940 RepID=A0ACB6RG39_9PLEO|nr:uncharacterized protein BDR25DRAFT_206563 [Lindgomyces ingoldianus]KAF2478214.1 hypothetical protein BDR25DRAFT_206563 [Lindgomyces ingoldianus]
MDTRIKCQICKKSFTQKSSLIRHSKRCTPGPAPSLRQKSCRQCTNSKTRCDLQRPKCSRCEQRDSLCEYITPLTRGTRKSPPPTGEDVVDNSEEAHGNFESASAVNFAAVSIAGMALNLSPPWASFVLSNPSTTTNAPVFNTQPHKDPFDGFPFTFSPITDPLVPVNQEPARTETTLDSYRLISDDWLLWNPGPGGSIPPLVRHSMETLLRVMKTWPKTLAKGFQTPPMLHFTHIHPDTRLLPLSNCITVTKMWAGQSGRTTEIVRQTVVQEMRTLFERYRSMDERHLLAALQALVFYTIILMFPGKGQISVSLIDPAIFLCLQRVVSYVAQTGLMLTEERDHERSSWESWIHVTAKRRAVFSLYLLHWSYSVYHGLPSFECSQLGFMPAPAPKFLWQAETKEKWEELYNHWLAQWGNTPYMMREFAAIQSGPTLERRSEIWLEDADELGVLFFSIGTTVHPCVEWW